MVVDLCGGRRGGGVGFLRLITRDESKHALLRHRLRERRRREWPNSGREHWERGVWQRLRGDGERWRHRACEQYGGADGLVGSALGSAREEMRHA